MSSKTERTILRHIVILKKGRIISCKMEEYYNRKNMLREEDLNPNAPIWAKRLIELYNSPLKYKIKCELERYENKEFKKK